MLPPMPQNHRTFLCLSDESIPHLPSIHPLYFISFFLLLALCQLNPPPFHLSPPLWSVCANPLPLHFFSPSRHPSRFLTSRSGLLPSLIDMFPFSKLHSLHHICSFSDGHFSFALFHSYVTLSGFTSLLSPTPGGLYFMQPSRSWANITVLVGAVDWVTAVWDSVLPT